MDQLYVDPAYFGRGLGSQLLDLAKAHHRAGSTSGRSKRTPERDVSTSATGSQRIATTDGDNEEAAPDVRYHWPGG